MSNVPVVPDYLKKYMAENGAGGDADAMAAASISIPRISLKGKKFQFINGDEESKKSEEIYVSILAVEPEGPRMIKTFYKNGYNPNDTSPPDCSSSNGVAPDSWVSDPVSQSCSNCPKNVFGSATSPTGKKTKACRDAKRLWVAKVDDLQGTVYGLNVPVTSLRDMADYGREIREMGAPLAAVVTKIYMDEDSEFPKLLFARAGFLNEEQGLIAIERSASREWINASSHQALAAPQSKQVEGKSSKAVDSSTIEGEARNVSSKDIDAAASNW